MPNASVSGRKGLLSCQTWSWTSLARSPICVVSWTTDSATDFKCPCQADATSLLLVKSQMLARSTWLEVFCDGVFVLRQPSESLQVTNTQSFALDSQLPAVGETMTRMSVHGKWHNEMNVRGIQPRFGQKTDGDKTNHLKKRDPKARNVVRSVRWKTQKLKKQRSKVFFLRHCNKANWACWQKNSKLTFRKFVGFKSCNCTLIVFNRLEVHCGLWDLVATLSFSKTSNSVRFVTLDCSLGKQLG